MDDSVEGPECPHPCSSGVSSKRKQPDNEDILLREGPLTEAAIENEYEHLDDDDDEADDDQDLSSNLKRTEFEQIKRAQEKATITHYDNIKVTPFNLEEELEEGQFDKAGNFIFKKSDDSDEEEYDTWAESLDWEKVEQSERKPNHQTNQQDNSEPTFQDKITCYKKMLRLMRPDENVKKTIQRLGNCIPKKRPMNKKSDTSDKSSDAATIAEARRKLDLMIELAHKRLEDGDLDIYQKSYEDLEEAIN